MSKRKTQVTSCPLVTIIWHLITTRCQLLCGSKLKKKKTSGLGAPDSVPCDACHQWVKVLISFCIDVSHLVMTNTAFLPFAARGVEETWEGEEGCGSSSQAGWKRCPGQDPTHRDVQVSDWQILTVWQQSEYSSQIHVRLLVDHCKNWQWCNSCSYCILPLKKYKKLRRFHYMLHSQMPAWVCGGPRQFAEASDIGSSRPAATHMTASWGKTV